MRPPILSSTRLFLSRKRFFVRTHLVSQTSGDAFGDDDDDDVEDSIRLVWLIGATGCHERQRGSFND